MSTPREVYKGGPTQSARAMSILPTPDEARNCIDLSALPKERSFLVKDLIPSEVVGLVVAPGGTGKSFVMASLAIAVTTGDSFMGHEVPTAKSVLLLSAEDDRDELHRRLHAILNELDQFEDAPYREHIVSQIQPSLYVVPLVGKDSRLCIPTDGALDRSPLLDGLIEMCNGIPNLGLIIVDPLSRFFGGVENKAEDGTRFVECLEALRVATGAVVIGVHHVNKSAAKNGDESQGAARGTSAFTDGVRLQVQLRVMTKDEAKTLKVGNTQRRDYVHLSVAKMNYGRLPADIWLVRTHGGVLKLTSFMAAISDQVKSNKAKVLAQVKADSAALKPLSKTAFVRTHGGLRKKLGIAEKALDTLLKQMAEEGALTVEYTKKARGRSYGTLSAT